MIYITLHRKQTSSNTKTGDELKCTRRVRNSCCISNTYGVTSVTKPVISHEGAYCDFDKRNIFMIYYVKVKHVKSWRQPEKFPSDYLKL